MYRPYLVHQTGTRQQLPHPWPNDHNPEPTHTADDDAVDATILHRKTNEKKKKPNDTQVAAAQQTAHTESLQVMSKRLAELYSEMGLPVGAGGGMPGAK